jgi:lysophospholipid acyltransferase (LPLAT)-like uncharacterized protein
MGTPWKGTPWQGAPADGGNGEISPSPEDARLGDDGRPAKRHGPASVLWALAAWPLALGLRLLTAVVEWTSRVSVEGPGAAYPGAALYVNWHRYLPYLGIHHGKARRWLMVSRDAYMAPIVLWNQLHGVRIIRGGSGDGGQEAMKEMVARLMEGASAFLAVDGPSGPALRAKRGCVEMARMARVPLIPVGYASKRGHFSARRWDHWLFMRPFDTLSVVYGTPLFFEADEALPTALDRVAQGLAAVADSRPNPAHP